MQDSSIGIKKDEKDLREFLTTIWKHKVFIVLFSTTITFFVLMHVLSLPNIYSSKALLVPQNQKSGALGGLSAVASFAGVSMGDSGMTPDRAYKSLLDNYTFMKSFVEKNNLANIYLSKKRSQNHAFAFGFRDLYDLMGEKEEETADTYSIVKTLQSNIFISAEKESGLITVEMRDADRYLAQKILTLFLEQSSRHLIENKLETINRKLEFYQSELVKTEGFELRKNISDLISKFVEEKITIQSSEYFMAEILTKPDIPHVRDKVGPQRGTKLVVMFVSSLVLAIFIILMREFLASTKEEKHTSG